MRYFPALALVALAAAAQPATLQAETDRTIAVSGEGRVAVAPDLAWIDIGVAERDPDAETALDAMSVSLAAVLDRLATSGIGEADIQTSQIRLDIQYDYSSNGNPRVDGYIATSSVQVRVRDLAILGKVLDAAVGDGANQIGGIRFDVTDRETPLNAAREAAVADAIARAGLFARAAGVTLGPLQSLSEAGGNFDPVPMMDARMAIESSAVPVATGEMEISASVSMVFAIAE
jgi:uncharacterized protein YggE